MTTDKSPCCSVQPSRFRRRSISEINDLACKVETVECAVAACSTFYQCMECGQLWQERINSEGEVVDLVDTVKVWSLPGA